MTENKITVWFDAEQIKAKEDPTVYISIEKIRGNVILTEGGYKLSLFLSKEEADTLAFAINCNLQQMELIKKEVANEGNSNQG